MKLSTVDLRVFAAVADLGGVTAAARRLGLTKSFVSRELAALEASLGARLVQRTTRKVSLTETGALLADYARRIVEEMDAAEAAIEAASETPRGTLTVSAPFSILRFVLAPRLAGFRTRFPDIRLSIDASTRVADLVEEGVDVAIRIGDLRDSSLVARHLAVTPLVLVASPAYLAARGAPARPDDLAAHDILSIRPSARPEVWNLARAGGEQAAVTVSPSIAVHDPGLVLDLVTQNLGVAAVPMLYASEGLAAGRVRRVLPGFSRGVAHIHAVYPSRRMLAPKVRAFIEFAAQAMDSGSA